MNKSYLTALGLGALSGLRSMSGPAWAAQLGGGPKARWIFGTLAAGETFIEKTPLAPDRISFIPLVLRTGAGAGAAAFASKEAGWKERSLLAGIGAIGAFTASYVFFYSRKWVANLPGSRDLYPALAEDAATQSLGKYLVNKAA